MIDTTYTLRERLNDAPYYLRCVWPARYAPVASIRLVACLATLARRIGLERRAARLAWWAYDIADHTMSGREFATVLPKALPWCYTNPAEGFLPVMIQR